MEDVLLAAFEADRDLHARAVGAAAAGSLGDHGVHHPEDLLAAALVEIGHAPQGDDAALVVPEDPPRPVLGEQDAGVPRARAPLELPQHRLDLLAAGGVADHDVLEHREARVHAPGAEHHVGVEQLHRLHPRGPLLRPLEAAEALPLLARGGLEGGAEAREDGTGVRGPHQPRPRGREAGGEGAGVGLEEGGRAGLHVLGAGRDPGHEVEEDRARPLDVAGELQDVVEEERVLGDLGAGLGRRADVVQGLRGPAAAPAEGPAPEVRGRRPVLAEPRPRAGGDEGALVPVPGLRGEEPEDREGPLRVVVHELPDREERGVRVPGEGRRPGMGLVGVDPSVLLEHLRREGEDRLRGGGVPDHRAEDDLRRLGAALLLEEALGEEDREPHRDLARTLEGPHEGEGEGGHLLLPREQLLEEDDPGRGVPAAEVDSGVAGLGLLPEEDPGRHQRAERPRDLLPLRREPAQEALGEGEHGAAAGRAGLGDPGDGLLAVPPLAGEDREPEEGPPAVAAAGEHPPALGAEGLEGLVPAARDSPDPVRGPVEVVPLGVDLPGLEPDQLRLRRRGLQILENGEQGPGAAGLLPEGGEHVGDGPLRHLQGPEDLRAQEEEVGVPGGHLDGLLRGGQRAGRLPLAEPLPRVGRPGRRVLPPEQVQERIEEAHGGQVTAEGGVDARTGDGLQGGRSAEHRA